MGVTYHTITDDWDLVHFILQNKPLPDEHTAENLRDRTLDTAILSCAIVDNAANIQKAVFLELPGMFWTHNKLVCKSWTKSCSDFNSCRSLLLSCYIF